MQTETASSTTRRLVLGRAVLSVVAGTAAVGLPAVAFATLPREADDGLPGLERLLAENHRRMMEVYDRREELQDETGLHSDIASVVVGHYHCMSEGCVAKWRDLDRITAKQAEEAIATLAERQAVLDEIRAEAGLAPFDAEFNRLRSEYFALRERVATAPVRTFEGLAVKLRQLLESAEQGQSGHEGDLARTALEGLERHAAPEAPHV